MSKEIMAECLEEAGALVNAKWGGYLTESPGDEAVAVAVHRQAIATIAVALYQERMKDSKIVACQAGISYEKPRSVIGD